MTETPRLADAAFARTATAWLARGEHLAQVAATGLSFEEWANWEAVFACQAVPTWRVVPRPSYRRTGVFESRLAGDLLITCGADRVLVEIAMVHDWTQAKWRRKLLADTDKLRKLAGLGIVGLQIVLRLRSGQVARDRTPWLATAPAWERASLPPWCAALPDGGSAEARGSVICAE